MTTSSSKDQCEAVAVALKAKYGKEMWFRGVAVEKDDAGLHVEMKIKRADLMGNPAPHVGAIEGVRVCVSVLG